MKVYLAFLISQFILLPIIVGLIRFRRMDKGYRPFFYLLLIGFLVEIISFNLIQHSISNAIPVNIYNLVECLFVIYLFHIWGVMRHKKWWSYTLAGISIIIWLIVNLGYDQIHLFSPYFRWYYYTVIVLLSINEINFMITHYSRNLFTNPKFLICLGFIVYFLYMIVYYYTLEISWSDKREISEVISFLMAYINAFSNIVYAIAFFLIPKPLKFTLE